MTLGRMSRAALLYHTRGSRVDAVMDNSRPAAHRLHNVFEDGGASAQNQANGVADVYIRAEKCTRRAVTRQDGLARSK